MIIANRVRKTVLPIEIEFLDMLRPLVPRAARAVSKKRKASATTTTTTTTATSSSNKRAAASVKKRAKKAAVAVKKNTIKASPATKKPAVMKQLATAATAAATATQATRGRGRPPRSVAGNKIALPTAGTSASTITAATTTSATATATATAISARREHLNSLLSRAQCNASDQLFRAGVATHKWQICDPAAADQHAGWFDYAHEASCQIERAYCNWVVQPQQSVGVVHTSAETFTVDFATMCHRKGHSAGGALLYIRRVHQ